MRGIIVAVGVLGVIGSADGAARSERRFSFTYGAVASGIPAGARIRTWIPLARNDRFQRAVLIEKDLPAPGRVLIEPEYENRFLLVELTAPASGEVSFSLTYDVLRREAKPYETDGQVPARFLLADRLVPVGGKTLDLLRGIVVPEDPERALRVLYDRVLDAMRYDKTGTGWGRGDAEWACESGFGNCTDFHSVWMSLSRASRIPARFEMGFPLPEDLNEGEIAGYHCWAWGHAGGRWTPVDISEADKDPSKAEYFFGRLDGNRIHFTTGRDIALPGDPRGGPVNFIVAPYVEVDGKPFDGVKVRCRFRDR